MGFENRTLPVGRDIGVCWLDRLSGDPADEIGKLVVKIAGHCFVMLAMPLSYLLISGCPISEIDELAIVAPKCGDMRLMNK